MDNILYLMHVHWGWIKQRPQFLAEHLGISSKYSVSVFCESSYKKHTLTENVPHHSITVNELSRLPFQRFRLIECINTFLCRLQLKKSIRKANIVWITHPYLYNWVSGEELKNARLVYDCMDDISEAPNVKNNQKNKEFVLNLEGEVVRRADHIFASSDNLKNKLIQRYSLNPESILVVNNAISIQSKADKAITHSNAYTAIQKTLAQTHLKKIMYIGTIGQWIDFDLIHRSLDAFPDIVYFFIGPKESNPKQHDRLIFFPPIHHSEVLCAMTLADALIMPFELSEFIQGVNPVKVYEYIYSDKPAIVVGYPETEKFAKYVNLYHDEIEFFEILSRLVGGEVGVIAEQEESIRYVLQNTWESRVGLICAALN